MIAGYSILAADDVIHASGTPVVIYAVNDTSTGNTLNLRNGTVATDTLVISETSTQIGQIYKYTGGILFPAGCFLEGVTNPVTVIYEVA